MKAMPDVLEALTDKFGPPSSVSDGTAQNTMGATFPQKTYLWSNGVSSLLVEGPFSEVDDMVVIYTLDGLQRHAQSLIDAKKRSKKNRM
jgi:hypothetical protein